MHKACTHFIVRSIQCTWRISRFSKIQHIFNWIWPSDNLRCSIKDELKNVKLLTDDAWQAAIGYPSDTMTLKKIHVLFTSIFVTPQKNALTLSHGQRLSQFKNRNNGHNNNAFSLSLNIYCESIEDFFKI